MTFPPSPIVAGDLGPVLLTPLESSVLLCLEEHMPYPVSKQEIVEEAWGQPGAATDDALKSIVCALRAKVGREHVVTVRGYGYALATGWQPPRTPPRV